MTLSLTYYFETIEELKAHICKVGEPCPAACEAEQPKAEEAPAKKKRGRPKKQPVEQTETKEEPASDVMPLDEFKPAVYELVKTVGKDAAMECLRKHGGENIPGVPEGNRAACLAELQELASDDLG